MRLKKCTAITLALVLLLCLAACGGGQQSAGADTGTNTGAGADAAAPRAKDSVVIAIGSEPELTFANDLAVDYSLSEDGLTWTFTIRDDACFTDGERVTASDVAFTLETAKAAQGSVDLTYMASAEALDETTVAVTLLQPTSIFLNTVASVGIVPEHAYSEDYGRAPIGSGPYTLVEWRPQEQLLFTANEDYYGGAPAIKNVTVVFMSEDAALAAVQAGQVDVAYSTATLGTTAVDGYHVEAVTSADNRGFTLPVLPDEGRVTETGAPVGNNVTCSLEIRQAIACAIDRQLIADTVLNGFGRPAYSENDGMPWNNPECAVETDRDYARQLLADAGWADTDGDGVVEKDGLRAEFTCIYPSGDSVRQAVAMAAAEQVLAVGIKINVEGTSWDDITRRMFSEAVMMGWGSAIPNETYYLYHSEGALKDDFYNAEGYQSEVTDGYLAAAMEALTVEEANRNWQLVQWDGVTGASMRGECPWVWIVNLDHVTFVRDGLSIGQQPIHSHGHGLPLIQNLQDWAWEA